MSSKLKPCPFCGSTRVRVMYSDINKAHVVYCTNCKASTNIAVRKDDAIYLWNKRAEPERKNGEWIEYPDCLGYDGAYSDDQIVCSECHHVFSILDNCTEEFDFCPSCGADMRGEDEKA